MPTYEYRCGNCGHDLEMFQKFTDAALTVCPECGGELHKVFNPVGIVFKGSGFYSTDNGSRKPGKEAAFSAADSGPSAEDSAPATAETKTDAKSEVVPASVKSDKKPAKTPGEGKSKGKHDAKPAKTT